jgi:hypothetical protein
VCGESIGGVESIVDGGSCSNSACDNSPRAMLATALQQKLSVGIRGRRPTRRSVPLGMEDVIDGPRRDLRLLGWSGTAQLLQADIIRGLFGRSAVTLSGRSRGYGNIAHFSMTKRTRHIQPLLTYRPFSRTPTATKLVSQWLSRSSWRVKMCEWTHEHRCNYIAKPPPSLLGTIIIIGNRDKTV